jgi:hypothetical protein
MPPRLPLQPRRGCRSTSRNRPSTTTSTGTSRPNPSRRSRCRPPGGGGVLPLDVRKRTRMGTVSLKPKIGRAHV